MTQLILDIQKKTDLEELLKVLQKMKISFTQTEINSPVFSKNTIDTEGYLSIENIKKQYPDEWVLLANPQIEGMKVLGGTVIVHKKDKREMALEGRDIIKNYESVTHMYTGEIPKRATIGLMRRISH